MEEITQPLQRISNLEQWTIPVMPQASKHLFRRRTQVNHDRLVMKTTAVLFPEYRAASSGQHPWQPTGQ